MLLILMYHNIVSSNLDPEISLGNLEQHFKFLQKNFNITLPGQNLLKKNVCLTFDDAYIDFYHYVFPLLKKLNIPAVLAIPTGLIEDHTDVDLNLRLKAATNLLQDGITKIENSPLCTWEEIKKMVNSGLVYPASHSLSHRNLSKIEYNEAYKEICISKRNILIKLENIGDTLIYPFGAYNNKIQNMANTHYRYVMRIGGAINKNWDQKVLYRVNADPFWKNNKKISNLNFLLWKIKYYFNMLRKK